MSAGTKWEPICDYAAGRGSTWRLAVPGGWLYRNSEWDDDGLAAALCFVPDPGAPHVKPA